MRELYFILDIDCNKYYFQYRGDVGFCKDITSAYGLKGEAECLQLMNNEDYKDAFSGRCLTVIRVFDFN